MWRDFNAAMCLVLVIEGLVLLAAPVQWKQVMTRLQEADPGVLRLIGGGMVGVGLVALQFFR